MFSQFPAGVLVLLFVTCVCAGCVVSFYSRQVAKWSVWPRWLRIAVTHFGFLPVVTVLLFVAGLAFERAWWHTIAVTHWYEAQILLAGSVFLALGVLDASVPSRPKWMKRRRLRVVPLRDWRRRSLHAIR